MAAADDQTGHIAAREVVADLHARRGQELWGFARRQGLTDSEADDVVQEALLRLFRTLMAGTMINQPLAWTFRTTYRLAMDRHRLSRRWRSMRGLLASAGLAEGRDEALAVWSEVDRLPQRQRQVLYLRYRADLTFEAIGMVLGIGSAGARSSASRGLATLRGRFVDDEDARP